MLCLLSNTECHSSNNHIFGVLSETTDHGSVTPFHFWLHASWGNAAVFLDSPYSFAKCLFHLHATTGNAAQRTHTCCITHSYAQYPTAQVTQHFVHSTDLLPKRPTAWCQVLLEKRTVSSLVKQVHCHVHSSLWLVPFLSQINLLHATHPVYLIHLLILSFHRHTSPKQFLSSLIHVTTPVRVILNCSSTLPRRGFHL